MRIGGLEKRVIFLSLVRTDDGGGGAVETWMDGITVSAQFSPERGRERIQAGRMEAQQAGVLRIWSSVQARAITEQHRVRLDGRIWNIDSIRNPDQRNDMLEMVIGTIPDGG
ncbi:MAG TPA: phage head closure protein [Xanthobacteraceae bacterium]|nr:phage head closure protein [Xanthobacteraceae bacterium]